MRHKIILDNGWNFVKNAENAGDALAQSGTEVTLPHTWNATDGQDGGNDYYRGTCWYTRKLCAREIVDLTGEEVSKGEVWLEFEGAAMTADVYLNGEQLAHHEGGYSTFRVNLTGHLREENFLAVAVDNGENDRVYPQKADFTFYGGLYREVFLIVVPKTHFALGYAGAPGIRVTPRVEVAGTDENGLPAGRARVAVSAWVEGVSEGRTVRFILDGQERDVLVAKGCAQAEFELAKARLWNGLEDPYLYTVFAELYEDGTKTDEISARFGCRHMRFDSQEGFFLNGRAYPLRGVSRHQDRAGVGNALTRAMHREDLALILEMGANTIRLAHYQHAQYFYDLCDEKGVVVWAEIPYITLHMKNGRANTLSQMKELVVQNYNHPCIACWGLSNEITAALGVNEDLLENHRLLNDLCHELDATRPTTMAHVFMLETDSELIRIPDLGSYNLYFGWYLGELSQNDSFFDAYHSQYPKRCIGLSEYGADANPQFHSLSPQRGDYTETYQTLYHEHLLKMIQQRPYLWATHVWNMFDFGADGRDEGGKHGVNQKGLVTMDRKTKKDAFYLYKAYWGREPFVHICGRRYVDRAEDVTEVKVYSNQPKVTLYVDGARFQTKQGSRIFVFQVPISGKHRIEAYAGDAVETGNAAVTLDVDAAADIAYAGKAAALRDEIRIRRVEEPNPDYRFVQQGGVVNWFDKEDFKEGYYSIKDTYGELMACRETAAVVGKLMEGAAASRGDVAESVKDNPNLQRMMSRLTLESLLNQAGDAIRPEQIKALNAVLQNIKKEEGEACR